MCWSSTTSIRRKTKAAPRPIPAAPAIPSIVRGRVHRPGSRLTPASPTSRIGASTMVSSGGSRSLEAREKRSTTTDSNRPSRTAPATIEGTSVTSWSPRASAADCMAAPRVVKKCPKYTGRPRPRPRASAAECGEYGEVGDGPGRQRAVHPALMFRRVETGGIPAPGEQHREPGGQGERQYQPAPGVVAEIPPAGHAGSGKQGEGHCQGRGRGVEAAAHPQGGGQRAIAAPNVLLELVDLGERVEGREERAEGDQREAAGGLERQSGSDPPGVRRQGAETNHVDDPVGASDRLEPHRWHRVQ